MKTAVLEQKKNTTQAPGLVRAKSLLNDLDSLQNGCSECPSSDNTNEHPSMPVNASPFGHDFGRIRIFSWQPKSNDTFAPRTSLPAEGEQGQVDIPTQAVAHNTVNAPETSDIDGGTGGGGAGGGGSSGNICAEPISMNKVTSGNFLGKLSMGDYYPDLVGRGYWDHGDTGGPFDTGSRVGSNVQLWGDIRIPCRPDLFTLAQTVTYKRAIFNGVHDPKEGVVQDDIAKSGRDFSRAPARQEFFGGGGWAISMADPPSTGYNSSSNIEWDRDFVTSLVGPGGRKDVSWSTSIRVVSGSVTRNTIS